jgi:hypothetical protein
MHRSSRWTATALTTVGLGAAVIVAAMAARAPLSRSTPVNARSAQTPTTAVFMLLLGIGVVLLGTLAVLAWSGRRRKDDEPEREPPPIEGSLISKLVAILLPLLLGAALITAAVVGAGSAHTTPRSGGALGGGVRLLGGIPLRAGASNRSTPGFAVPPWLPWTVLGIVAAALAIGVLVLWRGRGRGVADAADRGAASAAVEAAVDALGSEQDPRRAVIAAYAAMQRTLGDHGVVRASAEAPREYLHRVLMASRATEREASTLTELFEEARYSAHPIPERVRDMALGALRSLQARLRTEAAH